MPRRLRPSTSLARRRSPGRRVAMAGQSFMELALVLPILLVLVAGIADFGRVFVTGLTLEAAARDAAEAAANAYVADPPGPLSAPSTGDATYYTALRGTAGSVVCDELRELPGIAAADRAAACPGPAAVLVCVHDGVDPGCATPAAPGADPVPAECDDLATPPANTQASINGDSQSRWVEVRACYHFTPLLHLPWLTIGDVWLQRTRAFTVPCWFVLDGAGCG